MARYRLVLLDRPAWFLPRIEQEEMATVGGEALVGWARLGESHEVDQANASLGLSVEELSRISLAYVARVRHTPRSSSAWRRTPRPSWSPPPP